MKIIKLVYVISHIDKANEFEWLITHIDKTKFDLSFISIHSQPKTQMGDFCKSHHVSFYHISYSSKKNIFSSTLKTWRLLQKLKPDIVHAHLFEGGLIGITAAWLARVKRRIYTRHHSNFHHKFFPNGLKFDKWINARSTDIIAITDVVEEILIQWEKVPAEKVHLIYHGFPIARFTNVDPSRISNVKVRHKIPFDKKIIGVISRYTLWKGVHIIIPAFKKLCVSNPEFHLVLANAKGDLSEEIKVMLSELPDGSYTEIDYEEDNVALFKCFDYFIHVPIDRESEAFGQIYIEAMLIGVPSVFTKSGIANNIVQDKINALIVNYQDSNSIYEALQTLINDESLCEQLVLNAKKVAKTFTFEKKMSKLESLYLKQNN